MFHAFMLTVKLQRIRLLVLLRLPPRIFIIFSGFQIAGWIAAVLFEIYDASAFSGTVVRVREFIPAWIVVGILAPMMIGELATGLFDYKNRRIVFYNSVLCIFWWTWLASLMVIVEPKNVAAFTVYAIIALFRAWSFAATALPISEEKEMDAATGNRGHT